MPCTNNLFVDHDAIWKGTRHLVDCSATTIICRLRIYMMTVQKFYNGQFISIYILPDKGETTGNIVSCFILYN